MHPDRPDRLARSSSCQTSTELKKSDLDLVVASTHEQPDESYVMIEGFGQEIPEPEMLEAIMTAHRLNQEVIALQHELLAAAGLPPYEAPQITPDALMQTLYERYAHELRETKQIHLKADRNNATKELVKKAIAELIPEGSTEYTPGQVKSSFHHLEEKVVRELILDGKRPDGRGPRDLRPIGCGKWLAHLPTAHGSAIFQRRKRRLGHHRSRHRCR